MATPSKRRKSKPIRFEVSRTDMQTENPPPKINVNDDFTSFVCSLQEEKSPTKSFKTLIPTSPAMVRAVEVQYSLGTEFPSCVKMMVKSQVSCGFWLGLPLHFCQSFLPKEDAMLVLEDENGEQCEVKYIAYKYGLSAGWKNFAIRHKLMEGDVLVFHLVETARFKVYIHKADDSNEVVDAVPLSLWSSEAHSEEITNRVSPSTKTKKNKHPESHSLTVVQKKVKKSKKSVPSSVSISPRDRLIEQLGNESEEGGSEVLECSRPSQPNLPFQEVKSFEDFSIFVNGFCIDRELPDDVRAGYFKLCLYKKQFLHDGLSDGLYYKLVAGMIGETVRIANEIKNCELTTSKKEFETWDNSLKSFELLGLKVGFLRDKIHTLATLMFESESALDIKRYAEAENEHKRVKDEASKVAAKLKELKESAKKFEGISGILKQKVKRYESKFKEEVDASW
ncbi:hypothetical protein SSX86_014391 [Deinandra increscens subsp. villosa]|uniref:TF-B3 domain-containing protein n=1 Tax=Deinandra increscens subsp. villosa TaxID=3103831 RepID=A0AAP0D728_9ASTR